MFTRDYGITFKSFFKSVNSFNLKFNSQQSFRFNKRKTPDNIFLIHLTIADLGILVVTLPMNFVSCLRGTWSFGRIGCILYGFSGGFFGFVVIMTMVCMSVERYFVIHNPFNSLKITKNLVSGKQKLTSY